MRRHLASVVLSLAVFFTLAAPTRHRAALPPQEEPAVKQDPIVSLDARRSMVITDVALLQGFTFTRFLDQLIARSGVQNLTAAQLYRQWFDTQNPMPGLADPAGPHCNDFLTLGEVSFNGFPRRCPTSEGQLAATPYGEDEYVPIAVVNRFDQTPPDGSNCGQFRVVFARRMAPRLRLHVILEPVMPNPKPSKGLEGCRAVAQFWADLTKVDSMIERRTKLEQFYFDGIPGVPPVIDPAHFGATGGIRTTQIAVVGAAPRMYQFHVTKDCSSGPCTLRMTPDVLPNMPYGRLFDSTENTSQAQAFQDAFVEQVPNLAVHDVNEYFMNIPRTYLMGESDPLDDEKEFEYRTPFNRSKTINPTFRNRIQAKLTAIASTLSPEQIILRAETQNCVGCHFLSGTVGEGLVFPRAIDDTQHITEDQLEAGELGAASRYVISSALRDTYVPHRMRILIDFLNDGKAPVKSQ